MGEIFIVIYILFSHFICDFVLQSHWQATNKSFNNRALLEHTLVYSFSIMLTIMTIIGPGFAAIFGIVTFITHTLTDYVTSRWASKLWKKGDVHNFFVAVGFDQWLHVVQLLLTYKLLT